MCPLRSVTYVSSRSLKEIRDIKRPFGAAFLLPRSAPKSREAGGKQQKAQSSGLLAAFCMGANGKPRFSTVATGRNGRRRPAKAPFGCCHPSPDAEATVFLLPRVLPRAPSQRGYERHRSAIPPARRIGRTSRRDRKSTRLNSSHGYISYAVFCLKKKKKNPYNPELNKEKDN